MCRVGHRSVFVTDIKVQGILICVGGLGLLVASDEITDKDWPALNRAKGDIFMIIGATLYGFSEHLVVLMSEIWLRRARTIPANATEEFFVRRSPLYEVVGQLGMWGTLINGIQAAGLEHHDMTQVSWNGKTSECECPRALGYGN